ncbi:MAG: RDD family protein [Acidobacteriota bacterium]|nr:RDD family protein [Acidobacteriota bacterium]
MTPETGPQIRYCPQCGRPLAVDDAAGPGGMCATCRGAQGLRMGAAAPAAGRYQYAGFWIRVLAVIIDSLILGVVQSILQLTALRPMLGAADLQDNPAALFAALGDIGVMVMVSQVISCAYEAVFVAQLGGTPGKLALGMRVVRPDGSRVDLGRAVGRYFAKILSAIVLCIGYIMVGFDAEKRGLHDRICDTRVVRRTN